MGLTTAELTLDWRSFFDDASTRMRTAFAERFPFTSDGDVSPQLLSLRDAIHAFPVPVQVLVIDAEASEGPMREGPHLTVVHYSLQSLRANSCRFHGLVKLSSLKNDPSVLSQEFHLSEDCIQSVFDLTLSGACDDDLSEFIEVYPFNIVDDCARYAQTLFSNLLNSHSDSLTRRFDRRIDFVTAYGLSADDVLPEEEIFAIDHRSARFVNLSMEPMTIKQRQESIRHIALIPQVTEYVRRTFKLAKRLYVLGHIEYGLFTVSKHYALLALDAAIHARWSATLGRDVVLECRVGGVNETITVEHTTHYGLKMFCESKKWSIWRLQVNGKPYPVRVGQVLDQLQDSGVISKWQRFVLENAQDQRNYLSHLEFAPIEVPSPDRLTSVAYCINELFHSLPRSTP